MWRKVLISLVGGATALVAVGGVGTHLIADTESTTSLDKSSTVQVGGHKALAGNVVAGRVEYRYHPLPWVGKKVSDVSCPTGLKAVAGARVTCTGKTDGGKSVDIPVTVVKATDSSVTWAFQR
ncbi:DUF4333 domain-containing protein [Streptomyces soliscabiei]|uniref:DUF4333 domain-containing protein n=1 Tax=Streptomyces soliscabiei TaxID=588897 RepID=UPI0029A24D08|nr:DUF4333 domain-containing protein [Streptomyces sp. NY05-11A]MDX2682207.1 DUF4333 domain-containing protein [Streptomyces sp. NY05-11A]